MLLTASKESLLCLSFHNYCVVHILGCVAFPCQDKGSNYIRLKTCLTEGSNEEKASTECPQGNPLLSETLYFSRMVSKKQWPRFILIKLVPSPLEVFSSLQTCRWSEYFWVFFPPRIGMAQALSVILAELFCYSAMQKQQAFRLINKSSTHLWCEK